MILAFFATIIHLFHRADRQNLDLKHALGTIASAVSFGAQTSVGNVLAGRHTEDDMEEALRNKKFWIDPATMKIITEGEDGYGPATPLTSPMHERKSNPDFLSRLGMKRRLSGATVTPTSPWIPLLRQPQTPYHEDTSPKHLETP